MKTTIYLKIVQNTWIKRQKNCLLQNCLFVPLISRVIILFLGISAILLPSVYAQDYTRWGLPQGAKIRIGKGNIRDIKYSPDGNRLIVQSSIGFWTYDAHTGSELNFIPENSANILGVSPDASIYVISDEYGTLQLRNLTDGSVKGALKGETKDIHRIAFSPDMRMLAGASDEVIHLWDLSTGEHQATLKGHTKWIWAIVFSPNSTTLASGSSDNTLRLWDVATGSHKVTLSKHTRAVSKLVFSPDGNTLINGDWDGEIQLWDVNSGQKKNTFKLSSISRMKFSPDGNTIVTSGFGGLLLWDVATGTIKNEFGGHARRAWTFAFSPDGKTLVSSGGDELFLWNFESGQRVMSISGHTTPVYGMAFSPNGNILATSNGTKIHLLDPSTGEFKKIIFGGHWLYHSDLAFSPDSNTLACIGSSTPHLWDVSSTTHIAPLYKLYNPGPENTPNTHFTSIAFSPDGQFLAAGNTDKAIHLWYMGRTYIDTIIGHTAGVTSIDFSRDNRLLVSGSNDHSVRLWDFTSRSEITTFTGHTDKVLSVAINPEASIVASGSQDNTIILWDIVTGESRTIHTGHIEGVRNLTFSVDGNTLVSSGGVYQNPDLTVRVWDVTTGEQKTTLIGHTDYILDLVFSQDGTTLATGSWDGTVLLWDYTTFLDTENEIQQLDEDVNRDGSINLQDLIFVASQYGQVGDENAADVNKDGVIDIADILLVAAALENVNAAPPKYTHTIEFLTAANVQGWINQAQLTYNSTPIYQKGIAKLEQLLTHLTPEKTVLLPNYPNPFNPETWIPYQLANPADVTLRIYSADGQVIRTLVLGKQAAGIYQSRNRAAYWDGKNEFGEPVASGPYYYTLSTGKYTATRKMVIKK